MGLSFRRINSPAKESGLETQTRQGEAPVQAAALMQSFGGEEDRGAAGEDSL